MKKNVNDSYVRWTAFFNAISGYSESARSFIKGLYLKRFPVNIHNPPFKNKVNLSQNIQNILDEFKQVQVLNPYIDIQHIIPESLNIDKEAGFRIGRIFFELDGIPKKWINILKQLDQIWVASEHNKKGFSSVINQNKICIIPECIDPAEYDRDIIPYPIPGKKRFSFLSVFDWRLQKGWDVLIESFAREFKKDDDVCLVLKVFSSAGFPTNEIREQIRGYMTLKMGLNKEKIPSVILIEEMIGHSNMAALYKACDAFVLPSRGEGWGRPFMEAMAMGLPVIGTRWGGHLDYMNDSNSFLIDCSIDEVSDSGIIEIPNYQGLKWANPSVDSLRQIMRKVVKNDDHVKRIAEKGQGKITADYNLERISDMVIDRLERIKEGLPEKALSRIAVNDPVEEDKKNVNSKLNIALEGNLLSHRSLSIINRGIVCNADTSKKMNITALTDEDFNDYLKNKHTSGKEEDRIPGKRMGAAGTNNQFLLKEEEKAKIVSRLGKKKALSKYDFHIYHDSPPSFDPPVDGYWIMMQPWEFGSLPVDWIRPFNEKIDAIWVYSNFLKNCYIKSGINDSKIWVIPPGIDQNVFNANSRVYKLNTEKKFKLLFVGGSIARKGIDNLLTAYINEFSPKEDICLVIKDVLADSVYKDLNIQEEIEKLSDNRINPEIVYIKENFNTLEQVASLYNASDCLVHPYKAEGFGLPIAEAMSCGIPVITTGFGSCLDFCDDSNAYLLDYNIEKFKTKNVGNIKTVDYPFWAEVDLEDLRKKMRYVFENYEEALKKAKKAKNDINRDFTWDKTTIAIEESLDCIGAAKILRFSGIDGSLSKKTQDTSGKKLAINKSDASYDKAAKILAKGDIKQAVRLLKENCKKHPYHKDSLRTLSLCYLKKGLNDKAIRILFSYLKRKKHDDEMLNLMGTFLIKAGQPGLAESFFKVVHDMNPKNSTVLENLEFARNARKSQPRDNKYNKYKYLLSLLSRDSKKNVGVTLCMIVKDEQDNLKKCLESVRDVVSEIIIVDTGSKDRTKDVAKSFGAKVIDYKWEDDFAAARNRSIEEVKTEWILFLDADERIDRSGRNFIKNLKTGINEPCAYYARIINISDKSREDLSSEHYSLRLFSNKNFRFKGCIHEQLVYTDRDLEFRRYLSGIKIIHTGYSEDMMERKNKNKRNLRLLKKAIKKEPDNAFHLYNLGVHLYSTKKYQEVINVFKDMILLLKGKTTSYLPFAYSFMAAANTECGNYAKAEKCAEMALKLAPELKDALYNLANAKFYQEEYEDAIDFFIKATKSKEEIFLGGSVNKGTGGWKSFNGAGASYIRLGKYREAAEMLKKAYEIESKSPMVILNLIIACKNLKKTEDIKKILKDSREVVFGISHAQQLANQLLNIKLPEEALRMLESVISVYEKNGIEADSEGNAIDILQSNIGEISFEMGDFKEAVKWYKKYFKICGNDGEAYKKCGIAYYKLGNKQESLTSFKNALKIIDDDWEIYNNIGVLLMDMDHLDEAAAFFRKSVDLNPCCLETQMNLGKVYILTRDFKSANIILENTISQDIERKMPILLFLNSEALFHLGKYEKAAEELLLYTDIDKKNHNAFNRLGLCLYKAGRYHEAASSFSIAFDLCGNNPDYYANLGNTLRKLGNNKDAELAYKCALLIDKKHSVSLAGIETLKIEDSINNDNTSGSRALIAKER